jgi:chitin disaccharide deacetylase
MKAERPTNTRIVICADDYGLSPGVGTAIRNLALGGRITAASCMTVTPHWASEAVKIRDQSEQVDFGLHVTLTDQRSLTDIAENYAERRLPTVGGLLRAALTGTLPFGKIESEIEAQIDAFERETGFLPRFFDSHHHVHQFPGIRDCLIAVLKRSPSLQGRFIRNCAEPLSRVLQRRESVLKSAAIGYLGRSLKTKLQQEGFRTNKGFTGFYHYDAARSTAEVFRILLSGLNDGAMMMCHPGVVDEALVAADSLTAPRKGELEFLASAEFVALLETAGLTLVRPSALYSAE